MLAFLDTTVNLFRKFFPRVFPLQKEMFLPMPDIVGVNRVKITFCQGEIIDGIKKVGFPGTVIPNKTIDLLAKRQLQLVVIFKIYKGKAGQMHIGYVSGQK